MTRALNPDPLCACGCKGTVRLTHHVYVSGHGSSKRAMLLRQRARLLEEIGKQRNTCSSVVVSGFLDKPLLEAYAKRIERMV